MFDCPCRARRRTEQNEVFTVMAHRDAKDVERDYYEYRRKLQEKHGLQKTAAKPRPVVSPTVTKKKAAPVEASDEAHVRTKPAAQASPPEPAQRPLKPEDAIAEAVDLASAVAVPDASEADIIQEELVEAEDLAGKVLDVEDNEHAAPEIISEAVPEETYEAESSEETPEDSEVYAEEPVDTDRPEEEPAESEDFEEEQDDEDFEEESDGSDEDDEGEPKEGGFGQTIRGVGSRLGGAIGGFLKSIGRRSRGVEDDDEGEPDADEPVDEAETVPDEPEIIIDDGEAEADEAADASAAGDDLPEPADEGENGNETPAGDVEEEAADSDAAPPLADGEIRTDSVPIDLTVAEEDVSLPETTDSDENVDAEDGVEDTEDGYDGAEDEDEEGEEKSSFLSGFFNKIQSLISRRRAESEDDDSDEDEEESTDDADEAEAEGESEEIVPRDSAEEPSQATAETMKAAQDAKDMEGEMKKMDNNRKSMTEMMAEGMTETPSLSRRERRMLAEAANAGANAAAAQKEKVEDDLDRLSDAISEDEQPTVEYKPVRTKAKKPVVQLEDENGDDEDEEEEAPKAKKAARPEKARSIFDDEDDEDEEEEEEEEDEAPKTKKPSRVSKKRPVYDDDDDDDEDDEDEEDEDEDDDLDEDEDDDDEDEIGAGKRVFGFLKALIAIALLLALIILALRIAEAGNYISLDWLRDGIGDRIGFVNTLFPNPIAR